MSIIVDTDGDGFYDDKKSGIYDSSFLNFNFSAGNPLDAAEFATLLNITDETGDSILDVNITAKGSSAVIDGAIFRAVTATNAGTGIYNTFLAIGDNDGNEEGFNSDDTPPIDDTNVNIDHAKTETVLLANIPVTVLNGVEYYEVRIDINDANSGANALISLDSFRIFTSSSNAIVSTNQLFDSAIATERYDIDDNGDITILLSDAQSAGSGNDDYSILIPVSRFAGVDPSATYFYLYAQMGFAGGTYVAGSTFEEFNIQNAVTLTGTKFNDKDGDGVRDAGEEGVGGVTIFIDTDKDGVLDAGERSTVTDSSGNYTFYGVAAGTYQIDEVIPTGSTQTTGAFETITITDNQASTHGIYAVDPIGNFKPIDISGTKFLDDEGDAQTTGDAGLPGVVIFIDMNSNGEFDGGDLSTTTGAGGAWSFTGLGTNVIGKTVNEVLPDGYVQTVGIGGYVINGSATGLDFANFLPDPEFTAVKTIVAVSGGVELPGGNPATTADNAVDSANDTITYRVVITNTGNVALDLVSVIDTFEGVPASIVALMTESVADNDKLDVNETWTYEWVETVSQAELDLLCAGDETITNSLAAVFSYNGEELGPLGNTVTTPVVCDPSFTLDKRVKDVDGEGPGGSVDEAGDVITYEIVIFNDGNVTLTLDDLTDTLEGLGIAVGTVVESGGLANGKLDPGETWTYTFTETVSQAELDEHCAEDEKVTNHVSVTFLAPDGAELTLTDSVDTPVVCDPSFTLDKRVKDVDGEGPGGSVDEAGDVITYEIVIFNDGNVTLTLDDLTDTLEGLGIAVGTVVESGGLANGKLDPGETWTYTFTETVSQAELDEHCAEDEKVTNHVSVTFLAPGGEELTLTDSVDTPVVCNPAIDVEKSVKTNLVDYQPEDADDDPDGLQAGTSTKVDFKVVVTNTGNVSLSDITFTDSVTHDVGGALSTQTIVYAPDGDANTLDAQNVFIDLDGDGTLDAGEEWSNFDTDGDGVLDLGQFAVLNPGESFTVYYQLDGELGQHENTATVTGSIGGETATDSDDANYFILPNEDCVGVGTPGFWGRNGYTFWDGVAGNEKHIGDPNVDGDSDPGWADGELLYAVDSNGDGAINGSDAVGLLVGDFNHNGLNDEGNAIFISLADARTLINASQKQVGDAKYLLGRDIVATWLNYLANGGSDGDTSCIDRPGTTDDGSNPQHYISDAINWLQTYAGTWGNGSMSNLNDLTDNSRTESFDVLWLGSPAVKTNSTYWQTAVTNVADHSAANIHSALDAYNNTGAIDGMVYCCDRDDAEALIAMAQLNSNG